MSPARRRGRPARPTRPTRPNGPTGGRGRREPERVGATLPGVLRDLGLGESARALRIHERWAEAVGPEVAAHCRPVALRSGVLEAHVDSSAWCQTLRLRAPEILAALRAALGDDAPASLWLRVG